MLGCYYYGWYYGQWLTKTVRAADPPLLGQYNNTAYGNIITNQMTEMKEAGIDFISVSCHGEDHGHILDAANETGIKITYFYESLEKANAATKWKIDLEALPAIIKDMRQIRKDTDEDCWLRINDRPVMMFYVTRCYKDAAEIFSKIRAEIPDVYLVGDEYFWDEVPDEKILLFDAVTSYNMYELRRFSNIISEASKTYLENSRKMMNIHSAQCLRLNVPLWGNAMPGYDDSGYRPENKYISLPRDNGEFFKKSLQDAIEVATGVEKTICITSYNEWFEDTQIEPCKSYGKLYLDMITEFKNENNL